MPIEWLRAFDERELELLLCGMQNIDVDDWRRHTQYRHYLPNSKQVQECLRAILAMLFPGSLVLGLRAVAR